ARRHRRRTTVRGYAMTLPDLPKGKRWWLVMTDIARADGSVDYSILSKENVGGFAWIAVIADDEDDAMYVLNRELQGLELKLRGVEEEFEEIVDFDELEEGHPELAANIASWDGERVTVWGVLDSYLAEGEA